MNNSQFIKPLIFHLFFILFSFGQENTTPKIKSIEKITFNEDNLQKEISYQSFNLNEKMTSFQLLSGDSTHIFRRSYKYNGKGLLKYEEWYNFEDDTLPSQKIETVYNRDDVIIQKRTYSDFKKQKILNEDGILIGRKTISNSGKITDRELYVYDNDLLVEIRSLDRNDSVYGNKLFKYNKLKQLIEEINISNNITQSKIEYQYNAERKIKVRSYFIEKEKKEKKEKIQPIENDEEIELTIDDTEQTYPNKWEDWEEKELYDSKIYSYNDKGEIIQNKTKKVNQPDVVFEMNYEYDKFNNWIKLTMTRNKSFWATVIRKIEYY